MNHQAHPKRIRLGALLLATLLFLGLVSLIQPASAASGGWNEHIELDGKFTGGQFTLASSTSQLFHVDAAAPGDSWSGTITVSNHTGVEMEVALLSITSQLDDLALFQALTLDLVIGGEVVYSGSYGATPNPLTAYYVVPNGDSLELRATVALPAYVGNEMMAKEMDSIWTFEARAQELITPMFPYTVKYLEKESEEELAPTKKGYAILGSVLTEYALPINGYTPDAEKKSVILQTGSDEIIFYYTKTQADEPGADPGPSADPAPINLDDPDDSQPDSDPDPTPTPSPGVKTGNDLTQSNTVTAIYLLLAILCALTALLVALRVREAKKRNNHR